MYPMLQYLLGIGGNGNPLQYSCLENPMDGGAWRATVHGVAKSRTRLSDFTFIEKYYLLNVIYYLWFLIWCSKTTSLSFKGGLSEEVG